MTEDDSRPDKRPPITSSQVVASAFASATSAVALSNLGVAGTVAGAALGSVIITAGSAFSAHFLDRGGQKLRKVRQVQTRGGSAIAYSTWSEQRSGPNQGGDPGDAVADGHAATAAAVSGSRASDARSTAVFDPADPNATAGYATVDPDATAVSSAVDSDMTATYPSVGSSGPASSMGAMGVSGGSGELPEGWSASSILERMDRRRRWKRGLLVAAGAFAMVMVAITGFELATGNTLSDTMSGNTTAKSRPSIVGGGASDRRSPADPGDGAERDADGRHERSDEADGNADRDDGDVSDDLTDGEETSDGSDGSNSSDGTGDNDGDQSDDQTTDPDQDGDQDDDSDPGEDTTPEPTPTPQPTTPEDEPTDGESMTGDRSGEQ